MRLSAECACISRSCKIQVVDGPGGVSARDRERELGIGHFELRCESARMPQPRKVEGFGRLSGILTLRFEQRLRPVELGARSGGLACHAFTRLAQFKIGESCLRGREVDRTLRS